MRIIELDGNAFSDLGGFYDEVEKKLCPGFAFGRSMDGFSDVLAGGLSEKGIQHREKVHIVWKHADKSKQVLSHEGIVKYLETKLKESKQYDESYMQDYAKKLEGDLEKARNATSPTMFDEIVELITQHGHTLSLE